jgi:hypothetical protein
VLGELKVVAVNVCDLSQDIYGLFNNLRANSVTRKNHDLQLHIFLALLLVAAYQLSNRVRGTCPRSIDKRRRATPASKQDTDGER